MAFVFNGGQQCVQDSARFPDFIQKTISAGKIAVVKRSYDLHLHA